MLNKANILNGQGFTDVEHDSKPAYPETRLPHPSTLQHQFKQIVEMCARVETLMSMGSQGARSRPTVHVTGR